LTRSFIGIDLLPEQLSAFEGSVVRNEIEIKGRERMIWAIRLVGKYKSGTFYREKRNYEEKRKILKSFTREAILLVI